MPHKPFPGQTDLGDVTFSPGAARRSSSPPRPLPAPRSRTRVGVGGIVGVDIEPVAREAALRDRPGAYDHYIVGDLASLPAAELASIAAMEPTAVLSRSQ